MNKGTVKWFNSKKGFGFITGEEGFEYFAHYSKIVDGGEDSYKNLVEGQSVSFDVAQTEKGQSAINIVAVIAE